MGQVTIINTLILSFPEYFLGCIIGLLLIGKHNLLVDKHIYFKITVYSLLSCVLYFFLKPKFPSTTEWVLINIVISAIIYIFVFKLHYFESIMASIFQLILTLLLDISIGIPIFALFGLKFSTLMGNNYERFIFSILIRLVHMLLILFIFKKNFKIINLENKPLKYKKYYARLFLYFIISLCVIFLLFTLAKVLFVDSNKTNTLIRINIYILPCILSLLVVAMKNDNSLKKKQSELSKKEFIQNLDYISDLLDEKKYNEATDSVDNLKKFISTNDIY